MQIIYRSLLCGDLGIMDEDGFVYFKQRLKRMIITSGYNVYPSQVENVIDAHPDVLVCTVIGVKDSYRMQKVKAFIVLKPGIEATEEHRKQIMEYCRARLPKYAIPREMEFRTDLPKTLVGKVAFTVLEKEEADKQNGQAKAEPTSVKDQPAESGKDPAKEKSAKEKKTPRDAKSPKGKQAKK